MLGLRKGHSVTELTLPAKSLGRRLQPGPDAVEAGWPASMATGEVDRLQAAVASSGSRTAALRKR